MLLTTFAPWRAHQPSNAADDLVAYLQQQQQIPATATVMRHIPVSFDLAPVRVIAKLVELRPAVVVCCGMAEGRTHLNLERYGRRDEQAVPTSLPLELLMADTHLTAISDCAGTYVCNHLYYRVLGAIAAQSWPIQALFVHVPTLTPATQPLLAHDLALIFRRLAGAEGSPTPQPWAMQPPIPNHIGHDLGHDRVYQRLRAEGTDASPLRPTQSMNRIFKNKTTTTFSHQ